MIRNVASFKNDFISGRCNCLTGLLASRKFHLNVSPRIEIEYCTGCRWMLRSAWLAQEILTTFQDTVGEVALIPQREKAGTFVVRVDDKVVWDRKESDTPGFPEAKDLKNRIRNIIAPEKDLGHSEIPKKASISYNNIINVLIYLNY